MKIKYLSDYKLVRSALNNDRYAFLEIMRNNKVQVAKTVIGLLGNSQEAEDVGQEVFIRFFQSMSKYEGNSSLATYITRIAINLSLNELKKRKKRPTDEIEKYAFKLSADNEMEKKENGDVVTNALQQLEPDFRSVIVLRMIQGFSSKETAEILNLPIGTVLSRLSRGLQKLKDILKQDMILL